MGSGWSATTRHVTELNQRWRTIMETKTSLSLSPSSDTMDKHRWPSSVYTCASVCAHDFSWTPRHRHLCNCCQHCWRTRTTRMWHGNVFHLLTDIMMMVCVHMLDGITLLYLWLKISSQSECTASLSHRCKRVPYQAGWSIVSLVCLSHN